MSRFLSNLVLKRIVTLILVVSLTFLPIYLNTLGQKTETEYRLTLNSLHSSLSYSTYLGGNVDDRGCDITVATDGSYFIVGYTASNNFPTLNAYDSINTEPYEIFITKFDINNSLQWSTFFGGNRSDFGYNIAVTSDGSCYVTGNTESLDFPTKNAFNDTFGGGFNDAFIAKFSTTGSLLWSSFLGGKDRDQANGIVVVDDGSCYVTGDTLSSDFPTFNAYNNTFGGNSDIFVTKFSSDGTLLWSTFLGGDYDDNGNSIAVASDGSCYITGSTTSGNFPTLNAFNSTFNENLYGESDVFVTKFSSTGNLLWSTFLGGHFSEWGNGISVGSDGSCFLTGTTYSNNFPIMNAYDNSFNYFDSSTGAFSEAFITKFSIDGSLLWSTFLGGSNSDFGRSISISTDGSCYLTGETKSSDFPALNAYDKTYANGGKDAFVSKFSSNGVLLWCTYLGGDSVDLGCGITASDGCCYITGATTSSNYPTKNAYDSTFNGGFVSGDAFVTKIVDSTKGENSAYYGFLSFLVIIPILIVVLRKRKK